MSGTYLVCDLCGKFGPPAGFFFKDGIRMCYECYFGTDISEEKAKKPSLDTDRDNRRATPGTDDFSAID